MSAEIEAAIEELYDAFARPAPRKVEGCSCCSTEEQLRTLVVTPLRELTADQIGHYSFKALTTVGDADDLRYFWPRMVEVAARGTEFPDVEVVFSKPKLADWRRWPAREQAATERFVTAVLENMAETEYEPRDVDGWICAFGRLVEDLPSRLAPLMRDTPAARANLAGLYAANLPRIMKGRLSNPFWKEEPRVADEVAAWLRGDEVMEIVARHWA